MRIWARSENPEQWKIYNWVTKHNAKANDNIYACVTLHNAHTCNHIHWASCAFSQVGCRVFILTHTCTLAQVWVFHVTHTWPSMCVRSLHLDPHCLLLALPSALFPLPQLHEVCGKPAQLLQRECGRLWRAPPLHRQCQTIERNLLHWAKRRRIQAHNESRSKKVGSSDATSNAFQNTDKKTVEKPTAILGNARQNMLVLLMPTEARDQGQKELDTNFFKITLLQRGILLLVTVLCANLFRCLKHNNNPDAKAAVEKEWEKLEKILAWQLTKVRNKNAVIEEARNKGRKVHFVSEKGLVIWCVTCLIHGCSLRRLPPWVLPLLHLSCPQREHSEHPAHLRAPSVDKLRHQESLWREDLLNGGNTRTTTPTGYEPKELATVSRIEAYSGDPYQFFDVLEKWRRWSPSSYHRRSGGIWRKRTAGVPDSKLSDTSHIQSQMRFDDSVESIADSDLEDGEFQKMLTSLLDVRKHRWNPMQWSCIRKR